MTKALRWLTPCVLASLSLFPAPALTDTTAPDRTPPPEIIHVYTTPFCARLHDRVRPAVAMVLQNDKAIAKSQPLFKKYARGALAAQDPGAGNFSNGAPPSDSVYAQSPETSMALQQMSYLVSPLAQNILTAEKLLTDDEYRKATGNADADRQLAAIKDQLLQTIAFQSAALDLINGWVTTQQMGELQHAGGEYVSSISNGTGLAKPLIEQTPGPLQDPNAPGIAQNPYVVDPAAIPGLAVGYNPLSRIMDGMGWLQTETTRRENALATTITTALKGCNQQ